MIFKYDEALNGEIAYWTIFLRYDFNLNMLPTIDNATVSEIRVLYGANDSYVLNSQEEATVISAMQQNSKEKIEELFSKSLVKDNINNTIELEIEYENSPFVQSVGLYVVNEHQFVFSE